MERREGAIHRGSWFLIAGLLCTGAACAHRRGATADPVGWQSAAIAVHLNGSDNSSLAMEVYAVGSGITSRMGAVSPGTHQINSTMAVRP